MPSREFSPRSMSGHGRRPICSAGSRSSPSAAHAGVLPAIHVLAWPSAYLLGWIAVLTVCGTSSHYCLASAMRYADATIVVPMDFLRVPLTATVGWLLYSERLDLYTVL